ncbi:MAG TPA: hypothetical protein VNK81_04075 [Thermodesulfobacteriota bacterium]|jgi:hypothetical protein|nr:hypothetical protein [Thermodesulfobacteriota bacterium]
MPARTVTIDIQNATDIVLTKSAEHHCWGEWTPALNPHDQILPGEVHRFKSESGGPITGTEGYVKYQLQYESFAADGNPVSHNDTLYIYWNNPIMGVTEVKAFISDGTDVRPDCDADDDIGSTFGILSEFTVDKGPMTQAPSGASAVDVLAGVIFGPVSLFGMAGISEDAYVPLRVRRAASKDTTPTGTTGEFDTDVAEVTLNPVSGAPITDWRGRWFFGVEWQETIRVEIETEPSGMSCQVNILERFTSPHFTLQSTGVIPVTGSSFPFSKEIRHLFPWERGLRNIGFSAVTRLPHHMQIAGPTSVGNVEGPAFVGNLGQAEKLGDAVAPADSPVARGLGGALSQMVPVDQMKLPNGVTLELYGEFVNNTNLTRHRLRFIRRAPDGSTLVDTMLAKAVVIK